MPIPETTIPNTTTGVVPVPNSSIQPSTPITMPQTQGLNSVDANAFGMLLGNQADQTQKLAAQDQANANAESNNNQSLQDLLLGKEQFSQDQANAQNLPALQKQARDLQSTSMLQTANYIQGIRNIDQKNISQGERNSAQIEAQRQNGIDALLTNAQLSFTQGNIQSAQAQVKAAVDLKYNAVEQRIANSDKVLARLDAVAGRSDAKAVQAAKERNEQLKQQLADKKAQDLLIQDMIVKATPYAPTSIIAKANDLFKQGKSNVEIASVLGKYGGDYLGDLVKRSTLAKNDVEMEKARKEIKAMGTPLPIVAPAGSTAYSQSSWLNSAVNKESLSAGEREKISKSFAVTQQLGNLARNLQKDQTSFFGGKVREVMAAVGADADAGTIQAQITALVPQVARGTYGEVGVLTNADVKNYRQVIGNLSSPNDQNKAVTAMTLVALRNGVKAQLDTAAASKLDVSRFVPMYQDLTNQINTINDDIGVNDIHVKEYADKNPQVKPMVEELMKKGVKGSEILQVLGVEY